MATVALTRGDEQGGLVAALMDRAGHVDVSRAANLFRMSRLQLAETAGIGATAVAKADRRTAPRIQRRMIEMLEIVGRVRDWAGGEAQAMAWYRSEPIPAFGGRTAEALVKDGMAGAVRDHLDAVALGGFA
ncbi:antitoxin Xre/MbcA/ParS toxin-binding domain-containing protein [Sphingomonas bacterium]|uniref:antitoxin Xre/MbcA/ParS toxin-binding domain-containing protein n=1 Tax=Sphingomonas bacterium TaxID=1895847 RepID=UPI0015763D46|nr:antitoxin Xre/MbcA/ParS toxin-binding domain-containing protein [Sphingomonas bacterium]